MRKKRVQRKTSDAILSNNNHIKPELTSINDSSIDTINDELLKRLAQGKIKLNFKVFFFRNFCLDFVYLDKQTGIRWIGTKARAQPMNTLLSRFSWKPKINHYEKYSDIIRTSINKIFQNN
jgi:hypothetical protein